MVNAARERVVGIHEPRVEITRARTSESATGVSALLEPWGKVSGPARTHRLWAPLRSKAAVRSRYRWSDRRADMLGVRPSPQRPT